MKRNISVLILSLAFLSSYSQDFEVRMARSDLDYLVVQIREISGNGLPTTSSDITDLQFEICWPQSYGADIDVSLICDTWGLMEGLNGRQSEDADYWRVFAAPDVPFSPPSGWVQNQWETIGIFRVLSATGSGTGNFSVPPDGWVLQGLNFGLDGTDFTPDIAGSVSGCPYPTEVYEYVWRGGSALPPDYDEHSWTLGSNWEDPCGSSRVPGDVPGAGHGCIIPADLLNYPSNFNVSFAGACEKIWLREAAEVTIPSSCSLAVDRIDLDNGSELRVENGGSIEPLP